MRLIRLLKKDIAKETTTWVREGIISTEQAESICSRYGIDYHDQSSHSYGYLVLVSLGYLFIGLAMITLIGANWEDIPRALRMAALIAMTLGVNVFGLYKYRQGEQNAAIGWLFLGGLFYGASIMLIAQIYHIGEHYPDGIFWWAVGVLPLALLLESALLMMLAAGLGFIWFFVESSLNYYPTLFPLFLAALAWQVIRGRQSYVLFLTLAAGLGFWAEYALAWVLDDRPGFHFGAEHVAFGIGLFIAYHGLAKWLAARKEPVLVDYGTVLGVWALRFAIITLFVFSFDEPWRQMIRATWEMPVLIITLAAVLSAVAIWLAYTADKQQIVSTVIFSALYMVGLIAVMLVDDRDASLIFQVMGNVVLVAMGIWLIVRGMKHSVSHYFFLGVLTILVTGLLRYIDFVGDYVGAAILFAVFAAILLSAAKYWKSYRGKVMQER